MLAPTQPQLTRTLCQSPPTLFAACLPSGFLYTFFFASLLSLLAFLQFHYPEKRFLFKVVCEQKKNRIKNKEMPCSIYAVFCFVVVVVSAGFNAKSFTPLWLDDLGERKHSNYLSRLSFLYIYIISFCCLPNYSMHS